MDNNELKRLKQTLHRVNSQQEKRDFYEKYPLGLIWVVNINDVLNDVIWGPLNVEEKLQFIQNTVLYNVDTHDDIIKEKSLQYWISFFKKKGIDISTIDPSLQESSYYQRDNTFIAFGKLFSLDFFTKLNISIDIENYCIKSKNNAPTFLEIGGGHGALARILKIKYPLCHYIIIDLPETLFFAYINLRLNFPSAKIKFAETKDTVKEYISNYDFDFLLIPCFLSSYISSISTLKIDLVINTRSFGELHNNTSKYYINLIENKLNVRYILLLNRFLNNFDPMLHANRLHENGCFAQLGPYWDVIYWEIEPEFTRFPFHEQGVHPRELYLIAKKSTNVEDIDLKDIFMHCWYRKFNIRPSYHSKLNNNICIDTSKNGILARLVNSVRIKPNKENLDALIKYLYILEGKFPFEERYYYMDLYYQKTGVSHPLSKKPLSDFYIFYVKRFLNKIHLLNIARKLYKFILSRKV